MEKLKYTCPICDNEDHPGDANFCKICGATIQEDPTEMPFYPGQSVYYVPAHAKDDKSEWQLGRIKRLDPGGNHAFVWYHDGETAARTSLDELIPY